VLDVRQEKGHPGTGCGQHLGPKACQVVGACAARYGAVGPVRVGREVAGGLFDLAM
jgi:hypothetical protein